MLKIVLTLSLIAVTTNTAAVEPMNATKFGKLAINGYDAVAYFAADKAIKGDKKFTAEYRDVHWRFANQKNLNAFTKNPENFAPQYGGYCAWAMAQGSLATVDPKLWRIVEGKLYLNYNKKVQSDWEKDIPGFIKQADEEWSKLLNQ